MDGYLPWSEWTGRGTQPTKHPANQRTDLVFCPSKPPCDVWHKYALYLCSQLLSMLEEIIFGRCKGRKVELIFNLFVPGRRAKDKEGSDDHALLLSLSSLSLPDHVVISSCIVNCHEHTTLKRERIAVELAQACRLTQPMIGPCDIAAANDLKSSTCSTLSLQRIMSVPPWVREHRPLSFHCLTPNLLRSSFLKL